MLALLRPVGKWLSQAVRHTSPTLAVVSSASLPLTLAEADLPVALQHRGYTHNIPRRDLVVLRQMVTKGTNWPDASFNPSQEGWT